MQSDKSVLDSIRDNYDSMFTAEKKVADFILSHPERAVTTNVSELAELSEASDATVIRMCKRIGYEGYYQMKIKLSNDLGKGKMVQLRNGNRKPENTKEIFQVMASNLLYLAETQKQEVLLNCAKLIEASRMVYVIATGNTVPVAMDMAFRLGELGVRTVCSELSEYFINSLSLATSEDLVIGITHSGSSRHVVQGLTLAKEHDVKNIVITDCERSPAARLADILLCTSIQNQIFGELPYVLTTHLYETALIDALLYFMAGGIDRGEKRNQLEFLLSDSKL